MPMRMQNTVDGPLMFDRIRLLKFFIVLHSFCFTLVSPSLYCLDQNGNYVDWFIVYKLPILSEKHHGNAFNTGKAMFYLDPHHSAYWLQSSVLINQTGHFVFNTLQQIYTSQSSNLSYLMFNDETPAGKQSMKHGHAKGVLGFDSQSGFWLIHSVPTFPPVKSDGYRWSNNACKYGQSFLCVSFAYGKLAVLVDQLLYYFPQVYDYQLSPSAVNDFPRLPSLVNGTVNNVSLVYSVVTISSLRGLIFTSFAKNARFSADLYDALVAPTLRTDLLTETWQHARRSINLPSNCSATYKVFNIHQMQLAPGVAIRETSDHSKVAFSLSSDSWICIGGINRQSSQFKRGGGTLCFQQPAVWRAYRHSVVSYSACNLSLTVDQP